MAPIRRCADKAADRITAITHNHPEGMKGARATTHAIWLAFHGAAPRQIRRTIEDAYGYDLSRTVDEIRLGYSFDPTCQGTVPEAITCALESTTLEDSVRNAISLGGDADTLAAVAGPIAETMHGIPVNLVDTARMRVLSQTPDLVDVMTRMYSAGDMTGAAT